MEYLPEQELRFTPEQQVALLAERASHQPGTEELPKRAGRVSKVGEAEVVVNYDEYYNDHTYKVSILGFEAVVSPEGVRVMQPSENGQELVTDPEHRVALLGGLATKLRTSIESVELSAAA
jgi:hypothetical protein